MQIKHRHILWGIGSVVLFLVAFGYHASVAVWKIPQVVWIKEVAVIGSFAIMFYLLGTYANQKTFASLRLLWTLFLAALITFGLSTIVNVYFEKGSFYPYTIVRYDTWGDVIKIGLVSLLQGLFSIALLISLRTLILYKRTRKSLQNWNLMLVLMGFAWMARVATYVFEKWGIFSITSLEWVRTFVTLLAVGAMIVNAFRLSWVPYLSFRSKTAGLVTCFGLLALLTVGLLQIRELGWWAQTSSMVGLFSIPLREFVLLTLMFGILYCTTMILSLTFHLPTTGDFKKVQQQADNLATMHSLTHLVSQVFDANKLVSTITKAVIEEDKSQASWLAVADIKTGSLKPNILAPQNIDTESIEAWIDVTHLHQTVAESKNYLLLNEAPSDYSVKVRPGDGIGSLLVVPLLTQNELIGTLFVTKDVERGFELDDVDRISTFADQAALALDNARSFEERIEKERLSRELSIARTVQQKLLPQTVPQIPGLSIATSSEFAYEVGGDYFDFVQLDKNKLSLIIGDVSGKGTSAAFYMAELKGVYQSLSRQTESPLTLLTKANEALSVSIEKNIFISAICGTLDLKKEIFTFTRAGHCPIAMIDLHGNARLLRHGGLGLGLVKNNLFINSLSEEQMPLQPGDVYVLYTDGLIESRNIAEEEYGYERVLASLRAHRHKDAQEIHDGILQDLQLFIGNNKYFDDLTLVIFKWHGVHRLPSKSH